MESRRGGFENNTPGGGRDKQKLSPWDVLNPDRKLAQGLGKTPVSQDFMIQRVSDFLADRLISPLPRALNKRQRIAEALEDASLEFEAE